MQNFCNKFENLIHFEINTTEECFDRLMTDCEKFENKF